MTRGSRAPHGAPESRVPGPESRVLLVGVSTRAIAESATRAGYAVTAIDGFGDLDQLRLGRVLSLPRDFNVAYSARHAARAASTIDCDVVAYVANFENYPRMVARLAEGRQLLGNPPAVLERVRDPIGVARVMRERGVAVPEVRDSGLGTRDSGLDSRGSGLGARNGSWRHSPLPRGNSRVPSPESPVPSPASREWLLKPRASGGGHGITPWQPGRPVPAHAVLQERIDGTPGSIVFAADGAHAVPFAITRQLIGDSAFGASGFMYCGNMLAAAGDMSWGDDARVVERSRAMAQTVVEEFALVGVNGIDFVARDGVPYLVEINPRYTAAMELAERAYDVPVFAMHVDGCTRSLTRSFDLARARREHDAVGKAIVYARRTVVVGDTRPWLGRDDVRDVPHPGERITRGRPVCTIFARGSTAQSCYAALVRRAERVYEELDGWRRRSA